MPAIFFPQDWYWFVAGDTSKAYSSARNIYVPTSDPDYAAWLARNGLTEALPISGEADIWHYISTFQPWWLWDETAGTMSQPAAGQWTKAQLQNYDTDTRTRKVAGGMTAAGVPVKTDDVSRGLINTSAGAARNDPNYSTTWYGSDGQFYPVDQATMIAISDAVEGHTNDCYAVFAQVSDSITLNATTTLAQIDAAFEGL